MITPSRSGLQFLHEDKAHQTYSIFEIHLLECLVSLLFPHPSMPWLQHRLYDDTKTMLILNNYLEYWGKICVFKDSRISVLVKGKKGKCWTQCKNKGSGELFEWGAMSPAEPCTGASSAAAGKATCPSTEKADPASLQQTTGAAFAVCVVVHSRHSWVRPGSDISLQGYIHLQK